MIYVHKHSVLCTFSTFRFKNVLNVLVSSKKDCKDCLQPKTTKLVLINIEQATFRPEYM